MGSLWWRLLEADPELGVHVQMIAKRTSRGTGMGKGRESSEGVVSGEVPKRTGTLKGSVCLPVIQTHRGQGS